MAKFAIIENGTVQNIAIADEALADNWVLSEDEVAIGDSWDGSQFIKPVPDADAEWIIVRVRRNAMLIESDWTQLPDAPVDAAVWAAYRQELRDITTQGDPFNIIWPTKPE